MNKYQYKDFNDFEGYFVGKINGAFSRFDMEAIKFGLDRLWPGSIYVEVGTQHGRSTYYAACVLNDEVEMFAVDIFDPGSGPDTMSRKEFWEETGLDKRCKYINKPSKEAAASWDGRPIDMMFIDADHSYDGVKTDVDSWKDYVKSGGFIFFHDADDTSPDVERLVKELSDTDEFYEVVFWREVLDKKTSMASLRKK